MASATRRGTHFPTLDAVYDDLIPPMTTVQLKATRK
jgi:hypothetical protein